MTNYDAPKITELGSVAGLTRGQGSNVEFDGILGHIFGIPIPDLTGPGNGSRA